MEALIFVVALISLGMLAMRFGADSRPSIQSEEHRLAVGGMVWDAMSHPAPDADPQPAATIVDEPMLPQVVRGLPIAMSAGDPGSPFPTLAAIDLARGSDHPAFATDPSAALLEEHARQVIDESWSELVWLTGLVDQGRLSSLCERLESESLRLVSVVVLEDDVARSRGTLAHAQDA